MTYDVLVVSYNTRDDTVACLTSLLATGAKAESIHVADNGSHDGSAERIKAQFPGVHLHALDTNLYYAQAMNHLIESSRDPFILVLNPDVVCNMNRLLALCDHFASDPDLVAVAPQLRFPDGRVQTSCRRLPDAATPWREMGARLFRGTSIWKMGDFDHRHERDVEQPMFSALWIRRSALTSIGTMDASYPLFFNDVDWCRRVRVAGKRIRFDPSVAVTHLHGGTTRLYPLRKLWHAHRSFARYLARHSHMAGAVFGTLGVWLTFLARLPFCGLSRRA